LNGKVYIITHAENEGPGLMGGFFERLGWEEVSFRLWRGDELPRDPDSAAGIVMLGGPMNVYQEKEYPFLKKEDLFIREVLREEVPFLGICLGAQLLAKACGGAVTRLPRTEKGWYDVRLTAEGRQDDLFLGLGRTLSVFQWHDDAFAVPDGGILLATGRPCRNQAFKVGSCVYGLQFHPEVTADMVTAWSEEEGAAFDGGRMEEEGATLRRLFEGQARTIFSNFAEIMKSAMTAKKTGGTLKTHRLHAAPGGPEKRNSSAPESP
jgi:GMP synthase-like glutamine amidotransferase